MPWMTERQTQAYLLARDAIRRVQSTSSLVGEALSRRSSQSGSDGDRENAASAS